MKPLAEVVAKFPPSEYDFSKAEYKGALVRIEGVVCPVHGEFSQYAAQFRKGRGCPKCGVESRVVSSTTPQEEYIAKVSALHGGKYDYSQTQFTKMNARISVRCPTHGEFSISANKHFYSKQGCGGCEVETKKTRILQFRHLASASKINNTAKTFFDRCAEQHANKYSYPDQQYRGAKEPIEVVCPVHGVFQQVAFVHLSGRGCKACGAYSPKWEADLKAWLEARRERVVLSAAVLGGREIDLYLPDRQFGVELHGLRWHTESKRGAQYHREKWEAASAADIQLIQVFEDEWNDKRGIIEARLEAMLGLAPRYDARKLRLGICAPTEGVAFLNHTHIQGSGRANLYYGLWEGEELRAVASFGKARTGAMTTADTGEWEVIRYASTGIVRGGFSRLFRKFVADTNPTSVISYCDLRYGNGRVYKASGFSLDLITPPDYWWVVDGKVARVPRYQTQKHKLERHPILKAFYKPELSEAEICAAAGWSKIYGVGHQRWRWTP
jgi:hypothetical protein